MIWQISHRADCRAVALADRHYSRQKIGTPQFVPPGRCLVLYAKTSAGEAVWATSWPFAEYVKHKWAGAWVCSIFRNEGAALASKDGKPCLQLLPENMPGAQAPLGWSKQSSFAEMKLDELLDKGHVVGPDARRAAERAVVPPSRAEQGRLL